VSHTLILVRHGEALGSHFGVLRGRSDSGLSEIGRRQAALLAPFMADLEDARFVTSPLLRARETAHLALLGRGTPPPELEQDDDLQEMDFGDWEGLAYEQVAAQDPAAAAAWAEWDPGFSFPGGESLTGFEARMERAARALAAPGAATVVAFAHGGVVRALICLYLGLPLRNYLLFDVGPGCVAVLRLWEMRGVLAGLGPVECAPPGGAL
jgi:broad specificity phosphatase PhoE